MWEIFEAILIGKVIKKDHLTYPMAVDCENHDKRRAAKRHSGKTMINQRTWSTRWVTFVVSNIGNHSKISGPFKYHQLINFSFYGPT